MTQNKCFGCGSLLQTVDDKRSGYIKADLLLDDASNLLCQRCFRLKHYRDIENVELSHDDFVKILNRIAPLDALVIIVVDLFDISGSIIPNIRNFIGEKEIILVGNKRDILPKSIKDEKIKQWMRKFVKDYGYIITDIALVSAEKGHGIDELLIMMEKYRKNRNVYIIGCTNVGKSTLVNAIIKRHSDINEDIITVSQFPGTTLGLIEIPLNETNYLIDTPGIINHHQYAFYLDHKHLRHIFPKKEIKPKVYQLNSQQTLYFDGLARFDFIKGERTSFICYFSNEVKVHRTKLENADALFEKHRGTLLSPPTENEYIKLGKYVKHTFKTPQTKCDVVISGLGFISLKAYNIQIALYAPKSVGVYLRPSLF